MKIFIACSSQNVEEKYYVLVREVVEELLIKGHDIIYGASHTGMMGEIANVAFKIGINITGILLKKYAIGEKFYENEEIITLDSLSERKDMIVKNADVFLILPGGYGTLDEMMHFIETKRTNEHSKPIIIINYEGYYDNLLGLFDMMKIKNFNKVNDFFCIAKSKDEVFEILSTCNH